jgi:AAA15 family ATPase/GTPase
MWWRGSSSELELARILDAAVEGRQQTFFPSDDPPENLSQRFRTLLKGADFGIVDFRVQRSDVDDSTRRVSLPKFQLKHHNTSEDAWLPLEQESHGTRTLFRMALPILRSLERGTILLVDELESSLHPALAQQIICNFNDPATNPHNAQLVCTTHDTNLLGTTLGEPALRRDQVWFTEKSEEGATALYPLTDYKPRKAENLERGYLQGRYGAIPFLGSLSFSGE